MIDWFYNLILKTPLFCQWLIFIISIVVGFFMLVKGADLFVNSASKLAKVFRIPSIVVGLTIVAFGTSAPEASISIIASINNNSGISIGNIIGSNMFNLLLVLGISALILPVAIEKSVIKRDLPVMLISSYLLVLFAFVFSSGQGKAIVWFEGLILFLMLIGYTTYMVRSELKKQKLTVVEEKKDTTKNNIFLIILFLILSIAAIVVGGNIVNIGAKGVAVKVGVSETLAGLTICAIGTSLPELVTSVVAIRKHENDIAIGNVIGSNLFNLLFIIGVSAIISPLTFDKFAMFDVVLLAVIFTAFMIFALNTKQIGKTSGTIMILIYVLYFIFIIVREFYPII